MSHSENMKKLQEMLDRGTHCSQCVFSYWAERLDIDDEFAMRVASGLGMGVNHGDSCGAVTSTALVYTYEKRRAGNEREMRKRS